MCTTRDDYWSSARAAALANALPRTRLTHLDITGANITVGGAKALAAVLPQTSITSLNISDNHIYPEGAKDLAAALPRTSITALVVGTNYIDNEGAIALAEVFPRPMVTKLDLPSDDNNIGSNGARTRACALTNAWFPTEGCIVICL